MPFDIPHSGEDEIFDPEAPPISKAPAFTVLDVTKIPAREGQARCPRCGGAVFQAESMPCRGKVCSLDLIRGFRFRKCKFLIIGST